MKIYVSCDIEGLAGIATFDMEKEDTVLFRELYHQHVAWLIEGIQKSAKNEQITEITIADSHSRGLNLAYARLAEMDERISLVSGFPRMDYMMSGLDSSYDVVFFLGYHVGIGKQKGNMDHGYSASVAYDLKINDLAMNETTINAAYASELGVPVGLIIGESGLEEQLFQEKMMPEVPFVSTKESLGRYAIKNRPMQQVREAIVATTSQVLTSFALSELSRYALQTPATVKLQCVTTAQADRIEMLPMIKRIDGRTVSFVGETMKDVMNGIVAVVGLGGTSY
ncbi:M55 family metallopeptidase [Enterococcus faecalis]|uniref:M55 family metallopeptidase n=1 Tax=Enterococcus TaxID=1350 RepID=UPI00115D6F0D|nr:M55 family metallopeptidase [Enterococcus faecalis]EGO2722613.1 peptidase [Enterococcus faecalis]EGO2724661.1 peptidase [Enterococcus faecalis]EGO5968657.1 peptidase [Enterococcus faecalis]EGO5970971.1 peptidase [Enterococcus faecalis]EHU9669389.1 M55 family metallopeptidase [Enterococcus faecalis]